MTSAYWVAFGRSSKPLRPGTRIAFDASSPTNLGGEIIGRTDDERLVEILLTSSCERGVDAAIDAVGQVPLPPYLRRLAVDTDRERYQTVWLAFLALSQLRPGAALLASLLNRLRARLVALATVTFHVGPERSSP